MPVAESDARDVAWFRASIVYDRDRERESIVLSLGELEGPSNVSVTMRLTDRLPFASPPEADMSARPGRTGREALREALSEIRRRGVGAVAVEFDDRDGADPVDVD